MGKKYTIDLDLAPEDRFTEVVTAHKHYIQAVMDILRVMFRGDAAKQLLNATVVSDEQRREMQGIADALSMPYEDAFMVNFFYELDEITSEDVPDEWRQVMSRSCTGIVAQSSNGTIYHARNMDYPPPFAPLQYDGTFMKDGKVLFEGTSFASITGMGGNCMVPGKWSAEINARSAYSPSLQQAMEHASKGWIGYPQLLRKGCENGGDFEAGLKFLSVSRHCGTSCLTQAKDLAPEVCTIKRPSLHSSQFLPPVNSIRIWATISSRLLFECRAVLQQESVVRQFQLRSQ